MSFIYKLRLEKRVLMGEPRKRYIGIGIPGGWLIWDNLLKRNFGEMNKHYPDDLLIGLNRKQITKKT